MGLDDIDHTALITDTEAVAKATYDAYSERMTAATTLKRPKNAMPIPSWEEQHPEIRECWKIAAAAAVHAWRAKNGL